MQKNTKYLGMFPFGAGIIEFKEERERLLLYLHLQKSDTTQVMLLLLKKGVVLSIIGNSLIFEYKEDVDIFSFLRNMEIPVTGLMKYYGSGFYQGETISSAPEVREVGYV